jgi:hypothetical protein
MTLIEISRKLAKDAELEPAKADAIMQAVVEYSDTVAPVTRDYLDRRLSELRGEMSQAESRTIKWIVGTGGAIVLAVVGSTIGAVNFLAAHYRP